MTASTSQLDRTSPKANLPGLGYDFALLGLPARESRADVIRAACIRTSRRIRTSGAIPSDQIDEMLASLATSTYRLLDPRNRQRPRERINLSLYSELDWELQKRSHTPLLPIPGSPVELNSLTKSQTGHASKSHPARMVRRASNITASCIAWFLTGCALTATLVVFL